MKKKDILVKRDFKITQKKDLELQKYANKYHDGNVSEAIRFFISKGLSINAYKDEATFLREMIGEEIENKIEPYMNRLIKISVKGSVISASVYFLLGRVLEKFVPPSKREDYKKNLAEAKKLGGAYISSKDFKIEEYFKNIEE